MKAKLFFPILLSAFLLFTNIGCKKEGLDAGGAAGAGAGAGAGKANLTIETVNGPNKEDCGGFLWQVIFKLNDASAKGGWVVQQVTYDQNVIKCPSTPYINKKITYWEAWRVTAGAKGDSERLSGKFDFDDQYSSPNFPDTKGNTTITGEVKFFEGLELPAGFKRGNKATYAGDLPATTDKPAFWDNTSTVDHNLSYVWNCCVNPGIGALSHTATEIKPVHYIPADTSKLDNTGKLIFRIPGWVHSYNMTSQQLITIARQVQYSTTPGALHNSLVNYEKVFAGTTDYVDQLSKVYLMLRVMYQLPEEMNGTNARTFGGWIHPGVGNASVYNMSWPLAVTQSPSGLQVSVSNYTGFIGRGYNAAAELDYFNTNFQRRNL